jgi:S1-C subfamily serine protease
MLRTVRALPLALLVLIFARPAVAQDRQHLADALAFQDAVAAAIRKAEPSIACVLVSRSDDPRAQQRLDDPDQVPESYGSGVVIDDRGLILTNLHVIQDATAVFVRLPGGRGGRADIYAGDPRSDLAVLRLADRRGLPVKAITFGDGGKLRKGDFIVSLANPFAAGFRDGSPTASAGIVANLRRRAPGKGANEETSKKTLHEFGTLLQTDVRLNLGCSGGALVNLRGELVGLTSSLAALSGTETPGGFAIPIDAGMRRIITVLARGEEVEYGFLGVNFGSLERALPSPDGVPIYQVIAGSPAALAGLRGGETIRSVNGTPVHERDDVFVALGTVLAGTEARLEVARAPRAPSEFLSVKLAKFFVAGKVIATNRPDPVAGLRVDYASVLFLRNQQVYARGIPEGVMIREVVAGSPADTARLQESKVIARVNGRRVTTPDEFYREMRNAAGSAELTLVSPDLREERVKIEFR